MRMRSQRYAVGTRRRSRRHARKDHHAGLNAIVPIGDDMAVKLLFREDLEIDGPNIPHCKVLFGLAGANMASPWRRLSSPKTVGEGTFSRGYLPILPATNPAPD